MDRPRVSCDKRSSGKLIHIASRGARSYYSESPPFPSQVGAISGQSEAASRRPAYVHGVAHKLRFMMRVHTGACFSAQAGSGRLAERPRPRARQVVKSTSVSSCQARVSSWRAVPR